MNTIILHTPHCKFAYLKVGNGDKSFICFHGFGQSKEIFAKDVLFGSSQFTFYFIDLFYHGQSKWLYPEMALTKDLLIEIFNQFLDEEKIETFSIIGYSLGAKSVLTLLQFMPHKIEKCIFIAPDGIKTSFWYSAATYQGLLNKAFKYVCQNPSFYFKVLDFLVNVKLLDNGLKRFATNEMNTPQKRNLVYDTWTLYRELKFDTQELKLIFDCTNINFYMFLGNYDKVITQKAVLKKLSKFKNIKNIILPSSHSKLPSFVFGSSYFHEILKK